MEITDRTTLPYETRPEMFLSGEVHGNERVGPQAVTELAAYILENYDAERKGTQSTSWFTRMIKTRNLVIMPTANAYGYYHNVRTEHNIDPNRDFPYDSDASCMKTSAARAINEMYKHHLFQLAITFHSGMEAIAYEWGSYNHFTSNHKSPYSPDDNAQVRLGQKMRLYADKFGSTQMYQQGRMNDIVYAVHGGMEDWAYAASWDTGHSTACNQNGYDTSRTTYESAELRTFNILVETSNQKTPPENTLGDTSTDPLEIGGSGDGHVPRNMRLAALLLDVVQPYVVLHCPCESFADDIISSSELDVSLTIQWEVGGCFDVDQTSLMWGRFPTETEVSQLDSTWNTWHGWIKQVRDANLVASSSETTTTFSGESRWNKLPNFQSHKTAPFLPQFEQNISVSEIWQGLTQAGLITDSDLEVDVFVMATASVDSFMMEQSNPEPNVAPQSHFVNSRLRDDWDLQVGEHRVLGHNEWFSAPIKLHFIRGNSSSDDHDNNYSTTTESPTSTTTQGCNTRGGILCTTIIPWEPATTTTSNNNSKSSSSNTNIAGAVILAFFLVSIIALFAYGYSRWSVKKREGLYGVIRNQNSRNSVIESERLETGDVYNDDDEEEVDDEVEL